MPKFRGQLSPGRSSGEVLPGLVTVPLPEIPVSLLHRQVSSVRRSYWPMGCVEQETLDLPYIPGGKAPIIPAKDAKVFDRISLDASRVIHVALGIAQSQRARVAENGPPSVEARVAGAGDGSPAGWCPVYEDDVVEEVYRLETEHERRESALLEYDSRRYGSLQAMGGASANHSAKASQSLTALFSIVGEGIEPALSCSGRAEAANEPLFSRGEGKLKHEPKNKRNRCGC